ncbi:MAG TPA: ParB/RepB/Spo0J family partition protein [Ktedonobacteraceae bacterium]
MAKPKFGLGRGLDALISGASDVISSQQPTRIDEQVILKVRLDSIIPNPRQPRKIFRDDDARLLELSASISEHGLLQPLVVTRLDDATGVGTPRPAPANDDWFSGGSGDGEATNAVMYQIIAGERRWRASRLAGLLEVPVVLKEVTPLEKLELALIENIQREDLNAIEEALAYQALTSEFGLTQEQVAKQVGKDRTTITNSLRLLQLAPKIREALINPHEYPNFTEGHARALLGIASESNQVLAMGNIISQRLSVRQAEELAARIKASESDRAAEAILATPTPVRRSADIEDLETQFRDALTVKVDLKYNAKGKGTLVLHFNNQEELERLYGQLVKKES